jgi:hypothetical protein
MAAKIPVATDHNNESGFFKINTEREGGYFRKEIFSQAHNTSTFSCITNKLKYIYI